MSYFRNIPFVLDYTIQGKKYTGQDLTRRTGIPDDVRNNQNVYLDYEVVDGETPEMIADRFYGDVSMFFVITMFNQIHDINEDWPVDNVSLQRYVERAYNDPYGIHHYESLATGAIVDADHDEFDRYPVTNIEHETRLNNAKRRIRVPTPRYAAQINDSHKRVIRE